MESLSNILANAVHLGTAPFSEDGIVKWAEKNVILPGGGYAISGGFRCESSRHLIAPLEAMANDTVRRVSIRKATQTGGTLLADLYVPWTFEHRPGPVLWLMQKEEVARDHAETRVGKLIREGIKSIAHLLPEDLHKMRLQEIILRHGVPFYMRGPSLANTQSKSIRHLILDECWLYKPGVLAQAEARVEAFEKVGTSKIIEISQGSVVGDQFDESCEKAEQHHWQVPCVHCNQLQPLLLEERTPGTGKRIYRMTWNESGSEVRLVCRHCSQPMTWSESLRGFQNRGGAYVWDGRKKNPRHLFFDWPKLISKP